MFLPDSQTYGQSGTGKTQIVYGGLGDTDAVGLLPRIVNEIMSMQEQLGLLVSIACFTVNGDFVNDLLGHSVLRMANVDPHQASTRILTDKATVNDVLLLNRAQGLELLNAATKEVMRKTATSSQSGGCSRPGVRVRRGLASLTPCSLVVMQPTSSPN